MKEQGEKLPVLSEVEQTMLLTLTARAEESAKPNGIIKDTVSEALYAEYKPHLSMTMDKRAKYGTMIRNVVFDELTKAFIEKNPDGVCIYIGAGLDPRAQRLDNGKIRWYAVDLPSVINMRNDMMPFERETNIACSIFDSAWIDAVETDGKSVLIIMEGLLQFFTPEEVREALQLIADAYPGAKVILDMLSIHVLNNPKMMERISRGLFTFRWGVADAAEVSDMDERYQLLTNINLNDRMARHKFSMKIMNKLPKIKRMSSKVALYQIIK
ncbi:MAG: class I SAM-dependent methyltransferase [Eubacteriales bacterium]|nr:class I SAM-dependent methyltransferase [Eubacteriales bacterium]